MPHQTLPWHLVPPNLLGLGWEPVPLGRDPPTAQALPARPRASRFQRGPATQPSSWPVAGASGGCGPPTPADWTSSCPQRQRGRQESGDSRTQTAPERIRRGASSQPQGLSGLGPPNSHTSSCPQSTRARPTDPSQKCPTPSAMRSPPGSLVCGHASLQGPKSLGSPGRAGHCSPTSSQRPLRRPAGGPTGATHPGPQTPGAEPSGDPAELTPTSRRELSTDAGPHGGPGRGSLPDRPRLEPPARVQPPSPPRILPRPRGTHRLHCLHPAPRSS